MTQSNPNEQNVELNRTSLYWGLLLISSNITHTQAFNQALTSSYQSKRNGDVHRLNQAPQWSLDVSMPWQTLAVRLQSDLWSSG